MGTSMILPKTNSSYPKSKKGIPSLREIIIKPRSEAISEVVKAVYASVDEIWSAIKRNLIEVDVNNVHTSPMPDKGGLNADHDKRYSRISGDVGSDGFTEGSIPFGDSDGALTEDNNNLFWDNAENRLGIGTSAPERTAEIKKTDSVIDEVVYVLRVTHEVE